MSNIEFEGCYYITFRMERGNDYDLVSHLAAIAETEGIDRYALVEGGELPLFEKYDEHVPAPLLRKAYATDRLRSDEAERRLSDMLRE